MFRPARLHIDKAALIHNAAVVKQKAPGADIVAMVKADAYGCIAETVVEALQHEVNAFGVASIDEALNLYANHKTVSYVLFEGVFSPEEYVIAAQYGFSCVIHQQTQLAWLLERTLSKPIQIWIKVNTGMNRLGFKPDELQPVLDALNACSWVQKPMVLMSHFATADIQDELYHRQLQQFLALDLQGQTYKRSIANSAAICSPDACGRATIFDIVRPGIMLYGVSPFENQTGQQLGLKPVMTLSSKITAIQQLKIGESVGYGATWVSKRETRLAIVAIGYGDGYPRHISSNTPVWINGQLVPIVGRISMDMLTIDITDFPAITLLDDVELWGANLPVESIAKSANTIGYELLCQVLARVNRAER